MFVKLTETELEKVIGSECAGYTIIDVRAKSNEFTDCDHYGIALGKQQGELYVTWEFHIDKEGIIDFYWGHYWMEDKESALKDFAERN